MPYVVKEGQIKTKLFGVTLKLEDIGRQQLLQILKDAPQTIEDLYLLGTTCYISYEGKDYVLGGIREEYGTLLRTHDHKIVTYEVTGGYEVIKGNFSEMAALGCNLVIQLTKPTAKRKPVVNIEQIPAAHGEGTTERRPSTSTKASFAI